MGHRPDAKVCDAEKWLANRNVSFRRSTPYQLKIGKRVSYYPGRGTIFVDGEQKSRSQTGLAELEAVLRDEGMLRRATIVTIPVFEDDDEIT